MITWRTESRAMGSSKVRAALICDEDDLEAIADALEAKGDAREIDVRAALANALSADRRV